MVVYACAYLLVAMAMLGYSRWAWGKYFGVIDFVLDVVACLVWPLSLGILAFDKVRTLLRERAVRKEMLCRE